MKNWLHVNVFYLIITREKQSKAVISDQIYDSKSSLLDEYERSKRKVRQKQKLQPQHL